MTAEGGGINPLRIRFGPVWMHPPRHWEGERSGAVEGEAG